MALMVACSCKRMLRIKNEQLGKKLSCPFCRRKFVPTIKSGKKKNIPPDSPSEKKSPPSAKGIPKESTAVAPKTKLVPAEKKKTTLNAAPKAAAEPKSLPRKTTLSAVSKKKNTTIIGEKKPATSKTILGPSAKTSKTAEPSVPTRTSLPSPSAPKPTDDRSNRLLVIIAGTVAVCLILGTGVFFWPKSGRQIRKLHPVTGKVTFRDGSPLTNGHVTFFELADANASANLELMISKGDVGADGSYVMGSYHENDGVPIGRYKVVVTPGRPPDPDNPPPNWPPFSARFSRYYETPLEYTVTEGGNSYAIVVER